MRILIGTLLESVVTTPYEGHRFPLYRIGSMEIILVRHGEPAWTPGNRVDNNPELTDLGHAQAEALARRHWGEIDELWVSPLTRARQTAEPLERALGRTAQVVEWLEEIRNPEDWHGTPAESFYDLFREHNLSPRRNLWRGLPGGESVLDFHRRVVGGLQRTLAGHGLARVADYDPHLWEQTSTKRVLWVAHGGTNAVSIGHLLGAEPTPWEWSRFDSAHTAVAVLRTTRISTAHAFGLHAFGDVSHLSPDQITR
jgi:2,3-bisphosphoglycerate-dependent phosphoglycerate mutase